jgi:FkbM family methyltransferase
MKVSTSFILLQLLPYILLVCIFSYVLVLQETLNEHLKNDHLTHLPTESAEVSSSTLDTGNDKTTSWKNRLHFLETAVYSYLGFNSDPFFWTKNIATCRNKTGLKEYCEGNFCFFMDAMYVCQDDFPFNDCVVYDFGIRTQPHFGVILSKPPFNCQVYAFDPSPITRKWYQDNTALKSNPNYHLYLYGGGGADGNITLREYNWDQVSIYSYPTRVVATEPRNCTDGACRSLKFPAQKLHTLPVRSVESIMKELNHKRVDILKLDVEGSEYQMLEGLISSGACRNIDQITLEWHHYGFDVRYGASSAPILNMFQKLLQDQCGIEQFWIQDLTGWPSNSELYLDMKLTLMYNIASFLRVKK